MTAPHAQVTAPRSAKTAPHAQVTAPQRAKTAPHADATAPQTTKTAPRDPTTAPQKNHDLTPHNQFAEKVHSLLTRLVGTWYYSNVMFVAYHCCNRSNQVTLRRCFGRSPE